MFGDMLFSNTHSVEQLVDIKKKKKVDRVLLKVLKTVRSRGNITSWIKPESDLRKEFNISDKAMNSICESLSDYYQVSLESASLRSVKDMVQFIKAHVATAADSIFLVDSSTLDVDEDGITEDPNGPKENLEVDPEIVKSSEPSNPTEEKVPEGTEVSTETTDKEESTETPSQEIADVIIGGVALAGIIASGIKLYKEKKMADLCAWVNEHYSEVCSYIKSKMQGCDAFYKKRETLWRVQDVTDASESRIDQLNKIKSMPEPHAGEPPNLYKDRLKSHFGDKMENRIMPKNPAYLTIDEAGYLDASTTKEYVKSLSEAFDLQDEVDQKIDKIRHIPGGDSIRYINVLSDMNVMPFLHAMYKEQWTDNFNEHVLKVIAENVKKEDVTKSDDSSQEAYSVEDISVPKEKYNLYKKMETPESIAEVEKKIGFTFGKQTKDLFLHFNGIYYGTWEFMDLEKADGNTHATYEADDRLKGKTIDKLFVARDGFGNYLSVDTNDRVYIYQHDAEPAFKSESKLLDNFINEDYKKYEKYKSSKNKDVVTDRGRLKETNKLGAKSVESFSMENLQTSQPSGDWGDMLNSF